MFNIRIRQHERGLWFRHGDFRGLLGPGVHRAWSRLFLPMRDQVTIVNTLAFSFDHPLRDVLLKHDELRESLLVVELNDDQRALIWKDGRLARIVGPGRHAFWKTPFEVEAEIFDARETYRFEHPKRETVLLHAEAKTWLTGVEVDAYEQVLMFRDGQLVETLGEGKHFYWKGTGHLVWKSVDRRERSLDVTGQEIMTRDKVTLRVNLVVTFQVIDPERTLMSVADFDQALYRDAQLALRAAVGTRTLDALLTDKESVSREVREALAARADQIGVVVRGAGLRDVILPGDMKEILNQVIEAEKQAQANLIRRREETAAARSQANTAKLLAENPVLARMKELEAVQEILSGSKATFVLGRDHVVDQITRLAGDLGHSES